MLGGQKNLVIVEEEMGSFVMHSSQRHQQTCVERGAASRSRRAPDGGGGLFLRNCTAQRFPQTKAAK